MLNNKQEELCRENKQDFSDFKSPVSQLYLKALSSKITYPNTYRCVAGHHGKNNVETEILRPVDYNVAPGAYPDMKDHNFE